MRDRIERDAGSPFPPEPAAGYAFLGTAADKELSGAASVLAWNSRADAAARTRPKPREPMRIFRTGYMPFLIPCRISHALTG